MTISELLNINPVLITGIATSFIGICGALGIKEFLCDEAPDEPTKELLSKMYDRYCKKADEEDVDHLLLMEVKASLDAIQAKLDIMDKADKESLDNDILILEHNILFLQRKAIKYGKVSKGCMPRYRMLFKRYKSLLEKSNLEINEEAETNNEIVEKMFHDGLVVDSFWEMK